VELSCLQENLTKGLSVVNRAVSPRSTLDVLGNVLISAEEERVRLSATNLEIGIHCWIGADVVEDGSVAVPARILTDFVSSLPPEKVDISLDVRSMRLHLRCERYTAAINGIDGNEFPIIPLGDGERSLMVDVDIFRKMVAQTAFAASTQESRPSLTGILVEARGDTLTMVASDGYRLSHRTARLDNPVESPLNVLVPAKAMAELARISADAADGSQMQILVNDIQNQAIFHLEGKGSQEKGGAYQEVTFVSQLIDAHFPDYKSIIPKKYAIRAVTDTQSFLKAIRVAYLFARDEANVVRLELVPGTPGSILVKARSRELGENETQVQAEVVGESLSIGFNARYLIEALSVIDTPQVALETTAADRPGVLKPVGSGEEAFTYVMMPVKPSL
jgi:DNA polymerase-3 subunit beta